MWEPIVFSSGWHQFDLIRNRIWALSSLLSRKGSAVLYGRDIKMTFSGDGWRNFAYQPVLVG